MEEEKKQSEEQVQGTELQKVNEPETKDVARTEAQLKMDFRIQLENFTKLLNQKPHPSKIVKHKEGYLYLPVSSVEKDLNKCFFGLVQYEVISYQQILNEFVVHARLRVFHPVINEWVNYDGLGCGMFQQKANTPIQDFFIHKRKDGGKLTVPNAYAEAIKNAAKKIGKRFGSDLNRDLEDFYEGFIKPKQEDEEIVN